MEDVLVTIDLLCINNGSVIRLANRPENSDSIADVALVTYSGIEIQMYPLGYHGIVYWPCVILVDKRKSRKLRKKMNTF